MTITLAQALTAADESLAGGTDTVADIFSLIGTVNASVGNATALLNSGGTGNIVGTNPDGSPLYQYSTQSIADSMANGTTVMTIRQTDVGEFLDSDQLDAALEAAIERDYAANGVSSIYWDATANSGAGQLLDANQVLLGQNASGVRVTNNSGWDIASADYISQSQ